MDKTAIQTIQDSAAAVALSAAAISGVGKHVPLAALPDNFELHSLEPYMPGRARFRARFKTSHILSFAEYHTVHGPACIYINPDEMCATTIYNAGTVDDPGHGDHRASLQLEQTAPFREFLRFTRDGGKHDQRTIAEWVEDWREHVTGVDAEDQEIEPIRLAIALRKVDIEAARKVSSSEGDFAANRSVTENIEARASQGSLPSYVLFRCIPYHGLPEQVFAFRISILTGDDKLRFSTRRVREEGDTEQTADNFVQVLSESVSTDETIYQGVYNL